MYFLECCSKGLNVVRSSFQTDSQSVGCQDILLKIKKFNAFFLQQITGVDRGKTDSPSISFRNSALYISHILTSGCSRVHGWTARMAPVLAVMEAGCTSRRRRSWTKTLGHPTNLWEYADSPWPEVSQSEWPRWYSTHKRKCGYM